MERYQKDVVSNVYSTRAAVIHLHWQIFPKNGPFIEFSGHCNVPPDAERSIIICQHYQTQPILVAFTAKKIDILLFLYPIKQDKIISV